MTNQHKGFTKEHRIISKLISKYHIKRSQTENGKWWWIMKEPNELFCEVYTKKHAEQILRLLSFDKENEP